MLTKSLEMYFRNKSWTVDRNVQISNDSKVPNILCASPKVTHCGFFHEDNT